jgi:hypothetical protein
MIITQIMRGMQVIPICTFTCVRVRTEKIIVVRERLDNDDQMAYPLYVFPLWCSGFLQNLYFYRYNKN